MILREIAHARTGDKGNTSNIVIIANDVADFPRLQAFLTPERVAAFFASFVSGPVVRYEMPALGALNFVMKGALGGGVTRSLALDAHGKSLGSALLAMPVDA